MELLKTLIILCPLMFIAGFIDSIAGGGGLIAFPAYIWAGVPMHQTYGCNKFQSAMGTLMSMARYGKNGLLDKTTAVLSALSAVIFSAIGTKIIMMLSDQTISKGVAILLPVISFTMLINPKESENSRLHAEKGTKTVMLSALAGMLIGLYDSMFGPGGGTLGMLLLVKLFKYDYKTATANVKIIIFASNIAALIGYIASGNVTYAIALPASACNMLGSYIGTGFAIKKGRKIIKPLANTVVAVILIKYVLLPLIGKI